MRIESFTTNVDGIPVSFVLDGHTWTVLPDAMRWFERRAWWETDTRMGRPGSGSAARIDVEVWRLQARLGTDTESEAVTFEIVETTDGDRLVRSRTTA